MAVPTRYPSAAGTSLSLPSKVDGLALVLALRTSGIKSPVLFLTALGAWATVYAAWKPVANTVRGAGYVLRLAAEKT